MTWTQDLSGRVALVTGGAERVGADVAVNHLERAQAAAETVAALEATGRRAVAIEADVSSAGEGARLVEQTVAELGRLDILIHNASTFVRRPFLELTEEDFETSFGVGLRGPFFLSQAAARVMLPQGSGRIIALAGNSLYEAWPDYVSHALAKAGLARLMELLAVALSPAVQCTAIAPDRILWTSAEHDHHQRGVRAQDGAAAGLVELEGVRFRTGSAQDVAALVVELCKAGPYLNGAIIPLDGGKSRL